MRRWLIALTLVLALVGAGCSNDKKTDTAKSDKTSTKSDDKSDGKSDGKSSRKDGKFCDLYKGYDEDFADVDPTAVTDLETLIEQFGEINKAVEAMTDAAPDEIRDDLELVMGAALAVFEALVEADGDFTKIDPSALTGLNTPELEAATERLNKYTEEECGIDMSAG